MTITKEIRAMDAHPAPRAETTARVRKDASKEVSKQALVDKARLSIGSQVICVKCLQVGQLMGVKDPGQQCFVRMNNTGAVRILPAENLRPATWNEMRGLPGTPSTS